MKDTLGDRMKDYERAFTDLRIDPRQPVYARLDGRAFHSFTKGMTRPYDTRMSEAMVQTMVYLMRETRADLAYTQSDEISLGWFPLIREESLFDFDGKMQKLCSTLAGRCSTKFLQQYVEKFGNFPVKLPDFDCRLLNVPDVDELHKMFYWRFQDAKKNAVTMVAHHHFGHKAIQHKHAGDKIQMLADVGVQFDELPEFFRFGTWAKKVPVAKQLTEEELNRIPWDQRPGDGIVLRNEIQTYNEWPS